MSIPIDRGLGDVGWTPLVQVTDKQIRQTAYAFTYAVALHGLIFRGFSGMDCMSLARVAAADCVEGMKEVEVADVP